MKIGAFYLLDSGRREAFPCDMCRYDFALQVQNFAGKIMSLWNVVKSTNKEEIS